MKNYFFLFTFLFISSTLFSQHLDQQKNNAHAGLNAVLVSQLDSIHALDQIYRNEINQIGEKYGWQSKEMKAHWKIISSVDSSNLTIVEKILNTFGWLGADVVGQQGNSTLFLVIQHSNQKTQEKYT